MLLASIGVSYVTGVGREFTLLFCCIGGRRNVVYMAKHHLLTSGKSTELQ